MKVYVLKVSGTTKQDGRSQRHAAYQVLAPGMITWTCATCGGSDHGVPSGHGFSVSTASHDDVGVLAIDAQGRRIGVDITPRTPPSEFTSAFPEQWAVREAIGKASGVGIVAEPLDDVRWSVKTFELGDDLVAIASDHELDELEIITPTG